MRALALIAVIATTAHPGCGRIGFATDRSGPDGGGVTSGFAAITATDQQTCAILDGRAYCWGANDHGELGDGTRVDRPRPTAVALPAGTVEQIAQGTDHACAIVDGAALCWGEAALGTGMAQSDVPVRVESLPSPVTAISAGLAFSCAIAAGDVYCWGDDSVGRLGNGAATGSTALPGPVALPTTATALDCGGDHACALLSTGAAYCWGHNDSGALGTGSLVPDFSESPVMVVGVTGALPVLGGWHACAAPGGAAYCWGTGDSGELGDGLDQSSPSPVAVSGLGAGVTAIQTGGGPVDGDASCAVQAGVTLCWGNGFFGRLGNGSATNRSVPGAVMGGLPASAVEVGVGHDHACATMADGSMWCWGRGSEGQLGDGGAGDSLVPVQVALPAS